MTRDEMDNIRRWHAVLHDENSRGNPPDVQNASDLVGAVGDLLAHIDACAKAADDAATKVREEEFFGPREGAETIREIASAIRANRAIRKSAVSEDPPESVRV